MNCGILTHQFPPEGSSGRRFWREVLEEMWLAYTLFISSVLRDEGNKSLLPRGPRGNGHTGEKSISCSLVVVDSPFDISLAQIKHKHS
jgi:hypothetical protein